MLKKYWNKWKVIAEKIGNFNTRLILTLFYIIFVVPIGLIMKVFTDRLKLRHPSGSAWITKKTQENEQDYARRQF